MAVTATRILAVLGYGFVTGIGGWLGYLVSDREPPVVITKTEVLTPSVNPGGQLRVRYHLRRFRECGSETTRLIRDASETHFGLDPSSTPYSQGVVGEEAYNLPLLIPRSAAQGPAEYRVRTIWICNPLHHIWPIKGEMRIVRFEIRGPPAPEPLYGLDSAPGPPDRPL